MLTPILSPFRVDCCGRCGLQADSDECYSGKRGMSDDKSERTVDQIRAEGNFKGRDDTYDNDVDMQPRARSSMEVPLAARTSEWSRPSSS